MGCFCEKNERAGGFEILCSVMEGKKVLYNKGGNYQEPKGKERKADSPSRVDNPSWEASYLAAVLNTKLRNSGSRQLKEDIIIRKDVQGLVNRNRGW